MLPTLLPKTPSSGTKTNKSNQHEGLATQASATGSHDGRRDTTPMSPTPLPSEFLEIAHRVSLTSHSSVPVRYAPPLSPTPLPSEYLEGSRFSSTLNERTNPDADSQAWAPSRNSE